MDVNEKFTPMALLIALEVNYQLIRTRVIGYTRKEHLQYTDIYVQTDLPPNKRPIPVRPNPRATELSRN